MTATSSTSIIFTLKAMLSSSRVGSMTMRTTPVGRRTARAPHTQGVKRFVDGGQGQVPPSQPDQFQVKHNHGGQKDADRQDVKGLHSWHQPIGARHGHTQGRGCQPGCERLKHGPLLLKSMRDKPAGGLLRVVHVDGEILPRFSIRASRRTLDGAKGGGVKAAGQRYARALPGWPRGQIHQPPGPLLHLGRDGK